MTSSTPANSRILGVFAKEPSLGTAKTRLAVATSAAWAQQVAQAFLDDSLDRFTHVDASRAIVYAPSTSPAYFTQIAQGRYDLIAQSDGNLGDRLHQFFAHARRLKFSRILAIGADSPTLPLEWIEQAFRLLASHDVVIGPALDGGYYLIGGTTKELRLFEGIEWSTTLVLETTIDRVKAASARVALLPPWYDVDTVDDWQLLRGHVLAMRAAGINPGVPRVERLIHEVVSSSEKRHE